MTCTVRVKDLYWIMELQPQARRHGGWGGGGGAGGNCPLWFSWFFLFFVFLLVSSAVGGSCPWWWYPYPIMKIFEKKIWSRGKKCVGLAQQLRARFAAPVQPALDHAIRTSYLDSDLSILNFRMFVAKSVRSVQAWCLLLLWWWSPWFDRRCWCIHPRPFCPDLWSACKRFEEKDKASSQIIIITLQIEWTIYNVYIYMIQFDRVTQINDYKTKIISYKL